MKLYMQKLFHLIIVHMTISDYSTKPTCRDHANCTGSLEIARVHLNSLEIACGQLLNMYMVVQISYDD